ncbi:MAG: hypothetical protein WCC87_09825 [Candidatus Korobacteraceae bacterium]
MLVEQTINLVIALATCVAAIAACFAARSASKAAKAAESQRRAAWEQVKLQRPRPVVIVEGDWKLEGSDENKSDCLRIQNIGLSPAFDVDVAEIEGLQTAEYTELLTTERIFLLPAKSNPVYATHHRRVPGIPITDKSMLGFVRTVGESFPRTDADGNPCLDHRLNLEVTYKTLDERRYTTACQIRFNLGVNSLRAHVVPVSSWLGTENPIPELPDSMIGATMI